MVFFVRCTGSAESGSNGARDLVSLYRHPAPEFDHGVGRLDFPPGLGVIENGLVRPQLVGDGASRLVMYPAWAGLTHCSRDLRYVWANPAYAKLSGVPLAQIVGRPIVEVMGADAFESIRPYIDRVLRGERVEYEVELSWSAYLRCCI